MKKLPLPAGEHVMIHARTKGIATAANRSDYSAITNELLDAFRAASCKSIVVPTFTYSFTKSLRFSVSDSPSEVGRFSEEIRKLAGPSRRTVDPVFSVVDVDDFGWSKQMQLDAFGEESLWVKWRELNAVIVNLDLPHIVATQFHLIEKLADVPYRFDKVFQGEIQDAAGQTNPVDYNYYVRNLDIPSTWNRKLLESELAKAGVLNEFHWCGVRGIWFRAKDIEDVLCPIMRSDPGYLLDATSEGSGSGEGR